MNREPSSYYVAFDREIDVLDPLSFTPKLDDVFRALPKINRFNGQTKQPYSVALHSVYCTEFAVLDYGITNPDFLLAILFHDAAEAYIGDIVRPIKQHFNGGLYVLEDVILQNIYDLLSFDKKNAKEMRLPWFKAMLNEIDTRMAATEADLLLDITILPEIARFNLSAVRYSHWELDRQLFYEAYKKLMNQKEGDR